MIIIGIPKEIRENERRVATTPEQIKKMLLRSCIVRVERGAGELAGFTDLDFEKSGAVITSRSETLSADIVLTINRLHQSDLEFLKSGALLVGLLEPYKKDSFWEQLSVRGLSLLALEKIPRSSRAQSMDVLSSQANIVGYRAVIEAVAQYPRFFPMMMTSAGSSKPAQVIVLGAGVAGLQAIGTAKRLGAQVQAYDVRPEAREQILAMGVKFLDLELPEQGVGAGGYAKELSEEGRKKQQQLLTEKLKKADIIITTANVPGRKAPVLISEEAVRGMRAGSIIVDLAAPSGGNCELTLEDQSIERFGVKIIGITHYASLVPFDASSYFARNLWNLLELILPQKGQSEKMKLDMDDEIIKASIVIEGGH